MKHRSDDKLAIPTTDAADVGRRRILQALGAASVVGLPGMSFAQSTATVNTTKLAVTDTDMETLLTTERY